MPRDGSGQFYLQPGTEAVTGETIRSDQFNQRFEDVKNDLNAARPVAVGGTGATDATSARANLGAASQTALTALEGRVTPINRGGTGAATAAAARTGLGVPHVDGAATITGTWTYSQAALQVFPSNGVARVTTHRWDIGADWTWTLRHWANGDLEFNREAGGGVFKVSGAEVWTTANLTPTPAGIGAVPTARTVTAGDGLTGGGNLSANRSLAVDATVARTGQLNTALIEASSLWVRGASNTGSLYIRGTTPGGTATHVTQIIGNTESNNTILRAWNIGATSYKDFLFNGTTGALSADSFLGSVTALGSEQVWRRYTSRTHSTLYQNTTGKPICVTISATNSVDKDIRVSENASTWMRAGTVTSNPQFQTLVVPPGWYYHINGSCTIIDWLELS